MKEKKKKKTNMEIWRTKALQHIQRVTAGGFFVTKYFSTLKEYQRQR